MRLLLILPLPEIVAVRGAQAPQDRPDGVVHCDHGFGGSQ